MSGAADGATPSGPVWQPFTFGGLAVMARSRLAYVMLAQLLTAIFIVACIIYFLQRRYVPVVNQAIQEMPAAAKIAGGRLSGIDTTQIAESHFLAIAVTPEVGAQIGQTADMQVQFRPANFRIGTVFRPDWGWEIAYDPDWTLDLSRAFLEPWWGAWRPVVLAAIGVAVLIQLWINWMILALVYVAPVKCMAWLAGRDLSWEGSWRICSGALLPGAWLMAAGILLYSWHGMDMIGLAFFTAAHILVGWVYLAGGIWFCPRTHIEAPLRNPFVS